MTGKHRQSEVILRQSDRLMTPSSQPPPTGMRLMRRVKLGGWRYSVSQDYGGQVYVGGSNGVDRVTSDGQSSHVISVYGNFWSVSVNDGVIYALVCNRDDWSVRVYGSDYQLIQLWRHSQRVFNCVFNQLAVTKDSVLVPDRGSQTIIQYSLTGEAERRIPCPVLTDDYTWLCVMSPRRDAVIVSCDDTVSCIDLSTGDCVWSTASLEKTTAVCCDDADRVYVAVGGSSDTIQIAVLDGDTGKTAFTYYTHPNFSNCSAASPFVGAIDHVIKLCCAITVWD